MKDPKGTYHGKTTLIIRSEYFFRQNGGHLSVEIKTPRLIIRSVTKSDRENYVALFSDPNVMAKYATGKPASDSEKINERFGAKRYTYDITAAQLLEQNAATSSWKKTALTVGGASLLIAAGCFAYVKYNSKSAGREPSLLQFNK